MAVFSVVLLLSIIVLYPVRSEVLTQSFVVRLTEMSKLIQDQQNVTEEQNQLMENQKLLIENQKEVIDRQEQIIESCKADVYFKARVTSGQQFTYDSTIVWGEVRYNVGDGYNATTGKFEAPLRGVYRFTVTVMNAQPSVWAYAQLRLGVGGNCMALAAGEGNKFQNGLCSRVVRLEAGDEVWVKNPNHSKNPYHHAFTTFEGFMIHGAI